MTAYEGLPNRTVKSSSGVQFAYRDTGGEGTPLVALQHFRGNLDNWDPALVNSLASSRRVITFDNVGVGGSSGAVPRTISEMAAGALAFLDAMKLETVDILGFSIGSFVAQEIVLARPSAVNKIVLASSAPKGAPGMHGWAPDVIDAVGARESSPEGYLRVFFTASDSSSAAGKAVLGRIYSREDGRDKETELGLPCHPVRGRVQVGSSQPHLVRATGSDRSAGIRG